MNQNKIIKKVEEYLKKIFQGEATGHDWWHAWRVRKMAKEISKKEGGDLFIIELALYFMTLQIGSFMMVRQKQVLKTQEFY